MTTSHTDMVRLSMYSVRKRGDKNIKVHRGEFSRFPTYLEMMGFCRKNDIAAQDFIVKPANRDKTFFVGAVLTEGNHNGTRGRRKATRFYLFLDNPPTYEDLIR